MLDLSKLEAVLDPELQALTKAALARPGSEESMIVEIPTADDMDLTVEDLASLVARASNNYQRCCRFAGIARAELRIAEGKYKRAYRAGLGKKASNREERESQASAFSTEEHDHMDQIEALVELAEYQEAATRNASETARKLFDKVREMDVGHRREEHAGHPRPTHKVINNRDW